MGRRAPRLLGVARLVGSLMHTWEHFDQVVALARAGGVTPVVAGRHDLADLHHAQQEFLRGDHVGRIVIIP